MVKELTTKEFDEATKDGLVLIDLFATWCGPCRMLSPIVDEVSEEVPGLKVFKVDVDESPEIAERYNGETYNLPYHTPIELGEVVFNNTFVFPNGELTERYVEAISNI